ncbi:BPTI/Kunitz inhibitor domain-containing protein [Caenorhabditis elegans]|uniref:BPTI/Kunitz inhibitor domain-containing protein n=1 Tax=Caenorhabditis elegans TaxID=6239 RepID=O16784_CAEEL|nr:BPTI/Kunitz inhibitor domain-containing protein [Caenorhabditis elegans]CCD72529.1 BPTI/Kunitz inhibitor domain-containing protein [Caenorhabditis elegans]|eukprot:NP_499892.1 Uncharacterized protein CELE_T21D12.12 [Caenorhabditis elegans]
MLTAITISTIFITFCFAQQQTDCFSARDTGNSGCGQQGARSFYFHKNTRTCQPFFYQGCDGNSNRFQSKEACESACRNATASDDLAYAVCPSGAYPAGATSGQTVGCSNCPHGYECQNQQCCPTKENTCSLQYDAGKFGSSGKHTPRYFFSKSYKNCMLFTFYGRDGNANNFATYNECKNFCM